MNIQRLQHKPDSNDCGTTLNSEHASKKHYKRLIKNIALGFGIATSITLSNISLAEIQWKNVTDERLVNANNSGDWLIYGRTYDSNRFSPLKQITTRNIKKLKPVFVESLGTLEGQQVTPSINNGIMIVSVSGEYVDAIDATSGKRLWRYSVKVPANITQYGCCGKVNKGVALYGDKVFVGTLDARMIALDAKTGKEVWAKKLADYKLGYSITMAPMALKGKVLVGLAGGEFGAVGHILALDTETGETIWDEKTVPSEGEEGYDTWGNDSAKYGGGASWNTSSYDPELNLVYWGTGNPAPWNADQRPGDNLYTNSMLALDADTGKRKWYFQFVPHDAWDWDAMNEAVLVDLKIKGKKVKALLHGNKNGHFYALDRRTGKFLQSAPMVNVDWGTVNQKTGEMIVKPGSRPELNQYANVCPSFFGGKNWAPMSYNPNNGIAYIPTMEMCMQMKHEETSYVKGTMYLGASAEMTSHGYGNLVAFDVEKNKILWKWKNQSPLQSSSALATAGGVVFVGTFEGNLVAISQKTGKELWKFKTGSAIIGAPISYSVKGKQYIAVVSGYGGAFPLWAGKGVPTHLKSVNKGASLTVFAVK